MFSKCPHSTRRKPIGYTTVTYPKEIEILWRGNTAIVSGSMIVETVQNQLENY